MQENRVVTSFLRNRGRILILRRSSDVSSFPGLWAGVSGYIEGNESPLARAIKEIEEETGLSTSNISLVREGKTFTVDDDRNRRWIVHPFLFDVETDSIKLDREHVEYAWIKPDELDRFHTVPDLNKSLASVLNSTS